MSRRQTQPCGCIFHVDSRGRETVTFCLEHGKEALERHEASRISASHVYRDAQPAKEVQL